jgi:uncharacterized membrane protein YcaP (DUF421 family)
MSEIRQSGVTDLYEVEYAILEENGKLTVLPKACFLPPTAKDMGIDVTDDGLMHIVYSNGSFSRVGLALIGRDRAWVEKQLKRRGLALEDLFCVTANEGGRLFWISKEG